ncbi:universal stress protein [Membranihabitans maritimus]|uniref:universal stress protein n=1 Tax=Membranihabitans maritimus TaxID=2904244 RepID=UPI001F3828BA|nr:universal stress protein [Membranihabitans maritimus]
MRTVFLPTNFSEKSRNAMKYACDLFHEEPMHFVLLHAYDIPYQPNEIMVSSLLENMKEDVEIKLKAEEVRLQEMIQHPDSQITKKLGIGSVVDVVKFNEDLDADFIVVGIKGDREIREFLVGSNTEQIIKSTDVPVLVIPNGTKYSKYKNIVYGSDLKSVKDESIAPMIRLLERTEANLSVVHIGELSDEEKDVSLKELDKLLGERMTSFIQFESDEIIKGLERCVDQTKADLLVLVDRKRNFFQRIFHKSVTKSIGMRTHVPLLVLHE